MSLRQAVESVAADAGIVVVPMSVARLHHRKDVVAVPVTGVPTTKVGLTWPQDADDDRVRDLHRHRARAQREQHPRPLSGVSRLSLPRSAGSLGLHGLSGIWWSRPCVRRPELTPDVHRPLP